MRVYDHKPPNGTKVPFANIKVRKHHLSLEARDRDFRRHKAAQAKIRSENLAMKLVSQGLFASTDDRNRLQEIYAQECLAGGKLSQSDLNLADDDEIHRYFEELKESERRGAAREIKELYYESASFGPGSWVCKLCGYPNQAEHESCTHFYTKVSNDAWVIRVSTICVGTLPRKRIKPISVGQERNWRRLVDGSYLESSASNS